MFACTIASKSCNVIISVTLALQAALYWGGLWGAFDHELQLWVCCVRNAVTSGQGTQDTVLPPSVPAKGMGDAAAHSVPELPLLALLAGSVPVPGNKPWWEFDIFCPPSLLLLF